MKTLTSQTCPNCGKMMVPRTGKFGDFLGCSGYPRCKTIINGVQEKKELRKIANPSAYQSAIFDWATNGRGNAVVKATAGSGKTTVQEHMVALLIEAGVPIQDIIYTVYNAHVAKEAVEKGLPAKTTHQVALAITSTWITGQTGRKPEVYEDKVTDIIKDLLQRSWDAEKWMISPVSQIVSKLKNTLAPWDDASQEKICAKFGIEVNGSAPRIFELVRLTMEANNKQLSRIDFDDFMYLIWKFKIPVKQYNWVLGDEVQDWNRAQIELILKLSSGRVLCVGDENQSMYGFRGAAPDAMQRLTTALNAEVLPLSISYRNPSSHVDLVNRIFPDIRHEKSPYAKVGEILSMSVDRMLGEVKDGDLVICRTNAPLVGPVFDLIRRGVKATIRGRDIGKNLVALVERFNTRSVDDLIEKLNEYRAKEVAKLLKAEKASQAEALDDKVNTIFALSEGCDFTYQIVQKINEVFSDKRSGVIFSTVHRAKGDEAENVYILNPQLMPHKMAQTEEDMIQEKNILFVALTRSKNKMVFVGGPVPSAFESQEMWEVEEDRLDAAILNITKNIDEWDLGSDPEEVERVKKLLLEASGQTSWGTIINDAMVEELTKGGE